MASDTHPPTQHRPVNRAVSPVIGVVLMVAITIILAAVIGTLVLGMSPDSNQVAPIATVSFDTTDNDNISVHHEGGDPLDLTDHTLLVDGTEMSEPWLTDSLRSGQTTEIDPATSGELELVLRHDPSGELIARDTIHID